MMEVVFGKWGRSSKYDGFFYWRSEGSTTVIWTLQVTTWTTFDTQRCKDIT
jgi:hypothetical protein